MLTWLKSVNQHFVERRCWLDWKVSMKRRCWLDWKVLINTLLKEDVDLTEKCQSTLCWKKMLTWLKSVNQHFVDRRCWLDWKVSRRCWLDWKVSINTLLKEDVDLTEKCQSTLCWKKMLTWLKSVNQHFVDRRCWLDWKVSINSLLKDVDLTEKC